MSDSFTDVIGRLQSGEDRAAAEVFSRFTHRLIGLARLHLDAQIRQKVDPEDVLQSVYKSFFLRHASGQFTFDGWDAVWAILAVLTVRKCGRVTRHFRTAGRDVSAEASPPPPGDSGSEWQVLASGPTPPEVALLAELVERLHASLAPRDRAVVALALQGYAAPEIAELTGTPERTTYRILGQVKDWLARQAAQSDV